jgi:MATE family multidrug resistance protein
VIAEWSGALLGLADPPGAARYPGRSPGRAEALAGWRRCWRSTATFSCAAWRCNGVLLITVQGAPGRGHGGGQRPAAQRPAADRLCPGWLAHAVEALCGHAIGARDRVTLRRSLVVACGWSLITSLAFVAFFAGAGPSSSPCKATSPRCAVADQYLAYLAVLPLIAVWSYLLDGLFIGATRAREMRNAMLLACAVSLPLGLALRYWATTACGWPFSASCWPHGLLLAGYAWRLTRRDAWLGLPST